MSFIVKNYIKITCIIGLFFLCFTTKSYSSTELQKLSISNTTDIQKIFQEKITPNNKTIIYSKVPRGLILSIDNSIFFEDDKITLKKDSFPLLNKIGEILKQTNKLCIIEANSTIQNPTKNIQTNWEFSTLQAQKIVNYLIKTNKISPSKIYSIGFGESMPFNDNIDFRGTLNKRMDFVIINYENPKQ